MSVDNAAFTFIGLSGTGKTHYLVALDIVMGRGKAKSANALEHFQSAADRSYLQPLREKWLKGEDLLHTSRSDPPPPQHLIAIHKKSGMKASLTLPDLAGEEFDAHFVTRSFPHAFEKQVEDSSGFLLFVHSEHDASHVLLDNASDLQRFIGGNPGPEAPSEADVAAAIEKWKLELASRQVKLVDLLQFIVKVKSKKRPLKFAVIVSAWDAVETVVAQNPALKDEMPLDPGLFFEKRWPLLHQFMTCHPEIFEFRTYGVSARGGGTSAAEVKRLTDFDSPEDRVLIVQGKHRSNDLTMPISWMLGLSG